MMGKCNRRIFLASVASLALGVYAGSQSDDIGTAFNFLTSHVAQWRTSASSLPSAFGASAPNSSGIHIIGGWNEEGMHSSVISLEVCKPSPKMRLVAENAEWKPRSYFTLVNTPHKNFLLGGFEYNAPSNVLGDVWATENFVDWKLIAIDPQWEQREAHGAVFHNDKLYLFGGVTYFRPDKSPELGRANPSHLRLFADVWESRDGFSWRKIVHDAPWGPRRSFGFASFEEFILSLIHI